VQLRVEALEARVLSCGRASKRVMQMIVQDIVWLTLCASGPVSLLALSLRPPDDYTACEALRRSGLATTPAFLPVVEYVIRTYLLESPSDGTYYIKWPLVLSCTCAGVLLVASFLDAPLRAIAPSWSFIRLMHLVSWGSTCLLSVAMVLDI
jgi:hypothetical protein